MENKLREAEKQYHILFNQAPLCVLVVDPETKQPIEFNDVAHNQLGYSREEFAKLTIPDFEANETPQETRKHLDNIVNEGRGEFENRHRTKTGEIRNVMVTTRVVELSGKSFLCCIFHDITGIKKNNSSVRAF